MYTYTGSHFLYADGPFTTSDSITGWFTTSAPLDADIVYEEPIDPTSFNFSDGLDTFDPADTNPEMSSVWIATGSQGEIVSWTITLYISNSDDWLITSGPSQDQPGDTANAPGGIASGRPFVPGGGVTPYVPGTWTSTPTPEPLSVGLMFTALLALAFVARKRTARSLPRTIR